MILRFVLALLLGLAVLPAQSAEWLFSTRTAVFQNLDNGDLQAARVTAQLEAIQPLPAGLTLTAIGQVEADARDNIEPGTPEDDTLSDITDRQFFNNHTNAELKEFYIDGYVDDVDFTIGKQQIVWGKSDGIKILDIVNPQNFREFVIEDFDRSRIALWSARAGRPVGQTGYLELVLIPDMSFSQIPEPGASYEITSTRLRPPPSPVPIQVDFVRPSVTSGNFEWGAKWRDSIGSLEYSALVFRHFNDLPQIVVVPGLVPRVELRYVQTTSWGFEASRPVGNALLRTEAIWTDKTALPVAVLDGREESGLATRRTVLVGADWQVGRAGLFSIQYAWSGAKSSRKHTDTPDPDQFVTVLWQDDLVLNKWKARLFATIDAQHLDALWRGRLTYRYSDAHAFQMGVDYFTGDSNGLFGQFRDDSRWFVEWGWTPPAF